MRRTLVALLALTAAIAVSPASARPPSCYPLPDPACPPDIIIPAVVYNAVSPLLPPNTLPQNLGNPAYNVWPDANLAIIDQAGEPAFATPTLNVRQSGRLYLQNLDSRQHQIQELTCAEGGLCRFNKTVRPYRAAYDAEYILVSQEAFPVRGKTVAFQCQLHPEMQGSFVVS